jgi:hypothetical protein
VSEDFDPTAILERRVQDRDIRFPIQNHCSGFFRTRRLSHNMHAGNLLKALLESVTKVGIDQNNVMRWFQLVSLSLESYMIFKVDRRERQSAERIRTVGGVCLRTDHQ